MPNEFAKKPSLSSNFPRVRKFWKDPVTGLIVPKTPVENLQWRAAILKDAEEDTELQVDLFTAASQSLLFFMNAFLYTLRVFQPDAESGKVKQATFADVPFVTWEIGERHVLRIERAIDKGEDLLTDKSRDMGATWNHMAVFVHRFIFKESESHLIISRKEDAVDMLDGLPKNYPFGSLADPGTLFGKIDFMLNRLPEWMLPPMNRKKLHLVNLQNRTRVDGESANASAGSSDRRTSIFLDEMAKMAEGESIKRSTRDVTACRLPCSTPNGPGTAYSKWRLSGQIPVFILPWWEHPEKGRGRYVKEDDLGRFKIRSPWYDNEWDTRSPKEVAIEIDMDHVGSGDTFFEGTIIEEHRTLFARPPKFTMAINFLKKVPDADIPDIITKRDLKKVARSPRGPWKFWTKLVRGRLDQHYHYTVAIDISKGMGASNSTINIMCDETREKVAAFADANTPPYELARIACAACLWVGGRSRPLLIWENNGDPGFDFGRQVTKVYKYPNIYFDRMPGTIAEKKGKRYGWRSSPEKKAAALGLLRRAYAHGGFINHDEAALDEALTYISYAGGGIGPADLVEESANTRKAHGDRVIADMLCLVPHNESIRPVQEKVKAPVRSVGYRMQQWKKKQKQRQSQDRFDFTHA